MHDRFLKFIKKYALNEPEEKLLLAISGGVDSMFLWRMVDDANLNYGVAHCNFGLRGEESDGDEAFVQEQANERNVKFYTKKFDTKAYAKEKGVSTQMAARDLRYEWFDQICFEEGYTRILTAHHLNDGIETVLLNLVRGTSVYGLTGVPESRGKILRPLLGITKPEILSYAHESKLEWREDASNSKTDYKRNLIRLSVIPELEKLNDDLYSTFQLNIEKNQEVVALLDQKIDALRESISQEKEVLKLSLSALKEQNVGALVLSKLLEPFGFGYMQCKQILESVSQNSVGAVHKSETHEVLIDRLDLLIKPLTAESSEVIEIIEGKTSKNDQYEYEHKVYPVSNFELSGSSENAQLDYEKLVFPLKIRKWQEGDRFRPLGMKGQKLVSDFLIDNKVDRFEKENVQVLISGNEITWLIGYRISEDFKINSNTKLVFHINQLPNK